MRNTRWEYSNSVLEFEKAPMYEEEISKILYNRGFKNESEVEGFFLDTIENLMESSGFKDIDKAIKKIIEAKENNSSVWIYGDYDVDGITSTALCYLALKEIGVDVNYYIPLRDEGYGLNIEALSYIKSQGGDLVITVDCGISSIKEVEHANEIGLEIIITDHHEINNELPTAYAVINPKREDNSYDFKILAGVGTAFILLKGLYKDLKREKEIYKYLDIVAIGTIADIVELKGENRIIVKEGLERLKNSHWLGLNMLIKKIFENPKEKKFDTYDVGFIIAPIFNAAGRLEDAKMGVELLISDDHVRCTNLISELIQKNIERKELQERIFEKAIEEIESKKMEENPILIVAKKGFHHGVIGIVASKIVDRYYKPTIIMEIKEEEGIATASCRSIEGFNIIEALNHHRDFFIKYGGHSGAAGFSIPIEKIEEFSTQLNQYAKDRITEEDKKRLIKIDSEVSILKIGFDMMDKLRRLEPYGYGNSTPTFLLRDCGYDNLRLIGKEQTHIMFDLVKEDEVIKNCIWFNSDDVFKDLLETKKIDIVFKLKEEIYKDKYYYKIFIEDIKKSSENTNKYEDIKRVYETKFPLKSVFYTRRDLSDKKLNLKIDEDNLSLCYGKTEVGFLDNSTKNLLLKLHKYYDYNYSIDIERIVERDENFNIYIYIYIDRKFKTMALTDGAIFKDIKNHLIGSLSYNSIQQKILSSIFKEKKKVVAEVKKGRGIDTIIQTVIEFYKAKNIEVRLKEEKDEISVSRISENEPFLIIVKNLIDKEKFEKSGYKVIKDSYEIPKNIVLVEESELKNYDEIFSLKLPISEKERAVKKIKSGDIIYSTDEIKMVL